MPKSFDDILNDADFAHRDVPICLKRSARSDWETAQADLLALVERVEATRSGPDGKVHATQGLLREREKAAERVRDLESVIREHTVTFRVVGMPFADYNAVLVDHPPREGNVVDRALGYNTETFHPALIRQCLVDPQVSDEQWAKLVARLSDGDFDRLANAALEVNRRHDDGRVPFSYNASAETPDSEETSSSPDASE